MIQDIAPMKFHNEYQQRECRDKDIVFLFSGNKLLVKKDSKISFFYMKEFTKELTKETEQEADGFGNKRLQYLFSIDDVQYYLLKVWSKEEAEKEVEKQLDEQVDRQSKKQNDNIGNMEWVTIRSLRETVSKKDCFAAATAYHLYVWYRDNRYCGRCGKKLQPDTKERMMRCTCCGNMVYPKIAPAVIVGVIYDNKILMTKYSDREYKKYALIAGFTEIGETAEETVRREVMEEVGLKVKDIVYYKSQPWGFDSNLLMGFYARVEGTDAITLDKNELSLAEWVPREQVAGMDDKISLTREMMENFYKNGEKCLQ